MKLKADKRITIEAEFNQADLQYAMEKKNLKANEKADIRARLADGRYLASFKPSDIDGADGVIILEVAGITFYLESKEVQ